MSTFDSSLNFTLDGGEALSLVLNNKLRLFEGESWTNKNEGIPYSTEQTYLIQQSINDQVLETNGVTGIIELEVTQKREVIQVQLEINTIHGRIYATK